MVVVALIPVPYREHMRFVDCFQRISQLEQNFARRTTIAGECISHRIKGWYSRNVSIAPFRTSTSAPSTSHLITVGGGWVFANHRSTRSD